MENAKIYYDENTGCMLLDGIHEIPENVIEIDQETHDSILSRAHDEQVVVVDGQVVIKKIELSVAEKLTEAKGAKTGEITNARDVALLSGFEFNGKLYDSDPESMQNINGLVTQTLLQPTFSTSFITKDNDIVQLNAYEIKALGEAARAFKEQVVFKARALKDAIIAATTIEEVEAIKW